MTTPPKRTGVTTEQIRNAPPDAIFIWPYAVSIHHPRQLARDLGREDLEIIPLCAFDEKYLGRNPVRRVVVDHAVGCLSYKQCRILEWMGQHQSGI